VVQLKKHIVQSIAEMEVLKDTQPRSQAEAPEPVLRVP